MTVQYKTESGNGSLRFDIRCSLTGAEPRPCQYSDGKYLPDLVQFTLTCFANGNPGHPRYADLKLHGLRLSGLRLKKDGTPGTLRKDEDFYLSRREECPQWLTDIIEEHLAALRAYG